ncbi:hypothetical protein FRX31_026239 [Thalictrum thalictroides]|uniref:Uncharacterized protein n=1 Tax=Thalictrum thalictroides TaxID=46969 RepID=A0A7J6VGZ4_THATH|nr:hypothetical protein FRX31_026239 [Thalictrum thalictroides]
MVQVEAARMEVLLMGGAKEPYRVKNVWLCAKIVLLSRRKWRTSPSLGVGGREGNNCAYKELATRSLEQQYLDQEALSSIEPLRKEREPGWSDLC